MKADVTIMGAGVFGLSCAWACTKAGARVRVIDPAGIGAGASGGLVGALSPHVPGGWNAKKQFQFEALVTAERWWAEVAEAGGTDPYYARTGRLQAVADETALGLARVRTEAAETCWDAMAEWVVIPAGDAGVFAPVSPTGRLVRDTLSARVHPRRALQALASAVEANGGEVVSRDGRAEGAVIWATGVAGLDALSAELGRSIGTGVKGQAALLRYDAGDAPQIFADGLHVVPHGDGTVAVGSTSERDWTDAGGTDAQLDTLIARARALVPALGDAPVIDRWAGLRPRASTRSPILGAWPGRPGHFIANGGFKIGFGIAPKVGQVMAALVLEGRDDIPAPFRPDAL